METATVYWGCIGMMDYYSILGSCRDDGKEMEATILGRLMAKFQHAMMSQVVEIHFLRLELVGEPKPSTPGFGIWGLLGLDAKVKDRGTASYGLGANYFQTLGLRLMGIC